MPGDDDALKALARAIARIEELLERLPLDVAKDLRVRVATLRMVLLDTRGVQEGSAPAEADEAPSALESIGVELRAQAPDVVVFVAKASEVDAAVDADLDALERVYDEVRRAHRLEPPLIAVITHCDLLEPKATRLHEADREPKDDVDEKLRHVTLAER